MSTAAIIAIVIGCVIAAPFIVGAIAVALTMLVGLVAVIAAAIRGEL